MSISRPRILLATPFSPLVEHDHAANDIALPLMAALAQHVDLHVYGADAPAGVTVAHGFTHHGGTPKDRLPETSRFGLYPYRLRSGWRKDDSAQVTELIRTIAPDHVHLEYLQTSEVLGLLPDGISSSITLHDITGRVLKEGVVAHTIWQRPYRLIEAFHVAAAESRAIRLADHVITLSTLDADAVRNGGQPAVTTAHLGTAIPEERWAPRKASPPRVVFGGAMWRSANEASARFLAESVMPLVWKAQPHVELHIIGARPTERLQAIGAAEPRIAIRGAVDDFDTEFLQASAVLAPSMVRAGVLLKALRSLALGCPTVLNSASAAPLGPLRDSHDARILETPHEWAAAIVELTSDIPLAERIGAAGRAYVASRFSWPSCAATYISAFEHAQKRVR